jgi:SpoVK/Ycf46/Vps4 family AAA+-type ATPase
VKADSLIEKRILVLSGPSGSGKTATIRALSNEMDFDIVEFKAGEGGQGSAGTLVFWDSLVSRPANIAN